MENLNELAAALAKAQGRILPAPKDSDNPYFKSKYASLPAVREAIREAFAENGLSVVQMPSVEDGQLKLRTLLLHSSGQSLDCGTMAAEVDLTNPQKAGSAVTYFRRYSLAALSGCVADEDDDAEAVRQAPKKAQPKKQLTGHDVSDLWAQINAAGSVETLSTILKGDAYKTLKDHGPADVYEKTRNWRKPNMPCSLHPLLNKLGNTKTNRNRSKDDSMYELAWWISGFICGFGVAALINRHFAIKDAESFNNLFDMNVRVMDALRKERDNALKALEKELKEFP